MWKLWCCAWQRPYFVKPCHKFELDILAEKHVLSLYSYTVILQPESAFLVNIIKQIKCSSSLNLLIEAWWLRMRERVNILFLENVTVIMILLVNLEVLDWPILSKSHVISGRSLLVGAYKQIHPCLHFPRLRLGGKRALIF